MVPVSVDTISWTFNVENSDEYQKALDTRDKMMEEALIEIDEFCEKNSWLNEIYKFCCDWNEDSVLEWRGKAAFSIEVIIKVLIQL